MVDTTTEAPHTAKLSVTTMTMMVVGSMVGAGVFSLPSRFAGQTGVAGSLVAWLIAGVGMLMLAFVFQNLAIRKPNLDSGVYAYAKAGFGEYLGFFSAFGYWASACVGNPVHDGPARTGQAIVLAGRSDHSDRLDHRRCTRRRGHRVRLVHHLKGRTAMDPSTYGVHSEVGRLRKVLVCSPGMAHHRLTPTNAADLLFDDVMWVVNAQRDHADFVNKMQGHGVEVVELHDLLAQTMAIPPARDWLLDRKITPNEVGVGLIEGTRAFLESMDPPTPAEYLIGGLATSDLPDEFRGSHVALARESTGIREYLMPPLPNTLYTRDTTCWLYAGVTLNPLY